MYIKCILMYTYINVHILMYTCTYINLLMYMHVYVCVWVNNT